MKGNTLQLKENIQSCYKVCWFFCVQQVASFRKVLYDGTRKESLYSRNRVWPIEKGREREKGREGGKEGIIISPTIIIALHITLSC